MTIGWHRPLYSFTYRRVKTFLGYKTSQFSWFLTKLQNLFTHSVKINTREFDLVEPEFAIRENLNPRKFLALGYLFSSFTWAFSIAPFSKSPVSSSDSKVFVLGIRFYRFGVNRRLKRKESIRFWLKTYECKHRLIVTFATFYQWM